MKKAFENYTKRLVFKYLYGGRLNWFERIMIKFDKRMKHNCLPRTK